MPTDDLGPPIRSTAHWSTATASGWRRSSNRLAKTSAGWPIKVAASRPVSVILVNSPFASRARNNPFVERDGPFYPGDTADMIDRRIRDRIHFIDLQMPGSVTQIGALRSYSML